MCQTHNLGVAVAWHFHETVRESGDEGKMAEKDVMTVAVVNFRPAAGEKENNLRRMLGFAEAASKRGADLILFPEMCLMGYDYFLRTDISMEDKKAVAETAEGESVRAMAEISKKYGNYIIYGAAERCVEKDCLYNSAFMTGPEGVIGTYQKIHPFADENTWCKKGERPFMLDTPWGPIGIGICYDSYQFPELMRYYVNKGCRLYLNPTAELEEINVRGSHDSFLHYYNTLDYGVICNSVFIASANLVGYDMDTYFAGGSCVLGPKNTPFMETDVYCYGGSKDNDQETVEFATIDLSLAQRSLCTINKAAGEMDYRPELYKKW